MIKPRKIDISSPFVGEEELSMLKRPLLSGWLTQGVCVSEFEEKFAHMHGVKYAIATTNCTTALHLALVALEIGAGDEVIVPSFTWITTVNVVEYVGATPVFCDINRETFNLDILQIESLITSRTKAIIPVHLFGLCTEMVPLIKICEHNGVRVIEDAACAVGASIRGKIAGSIGDIGCFSFHPRKIITTGEGGMCTTNDESLAKMIISLRNHGASVSEKKRHCEEKPYFLPDFKVLGFNYRMTDLQGALGLVQLSRLNSLIDDRRKWAVWYCEQLKKIPWLVTPVVSSCFNHSFQAFVCYVDETKAPYKRNEIMEILQEKGISTRIGTMAVHMQDYYKKKYRLKSGDFPVSRDCYKFSMAIPLHNRMQADDYKYVVSVLRDI